MVAYASAADGRRDAVRTLRAARDPSAANADSRGILPLVRSAKVRPWIPTSTTWLACADVPPRGSHCWPAHAAAARHTTTATVASATDRRMASRSPIGRRYRRATSATRQAREVEPARPVSAFRVFAHSLVEEMGVVTHEDPPGAATHAVEDDGGGLCGRHRRRVAEHLTHHPHRVPHVVITHSF